MTAAARARYRARQFGKAWTGGLSPAQRQEVAGVLTPALCGLFNGMSGYAQRHAYDVFHTLRSSGWAEHDLLVAALLHDVGKGNVSLLSRVLWVLIGLLGQRRRASLATSSPLGVGLGLRQHLHHARIGAALVRNAGGTATAARLVAGHYHVDATDPLLAALQRADNQN